MNFIDRKERFLERYPLFVAARYKYLSLAFICSSLRSWEIQLHFICFIIYHIHFAEISHCHPSLILQIHLKGFKDIANSSHYYSHESLLKYTAILSFLSPRRSSAPICRIFRLPTNKATTAAVLLA